MGREKVRLLHFADAHIDMANYGKHDPETGLPVRVMDFLNALDQIVERAIDEQVDLVLFAGDAYKDRNPQPTFQREWGKRIMKLSAAGICTVLLVGNHDVAPAAGRAHTLQEFDTLSVPHIHIADDFALLTPAQLQRPVQIITVPWVSRSKAMRMPGTEGMSTEEIYDQMEAILAKWIEQQIETADPEVPLIMMAHASVQGAVYGSERAVMLGQELVLSGSIVGDPRLDYVALGHIHKHQSLNNRQPVIYPGSIERIDFGESREHKGFVLAEVGKGEAQWDFVRLKTRRFVDVSIELESPESFMADIMEGLPPAESVRGAICRVRLNYPHEWEILLDEAPIYQHFAAAFSLQIQKHRQVERRARLGDTLNIESRTPEELLALYWQTVELEPKEVTAMQELAKEVFANVQL